MPSTEFDVVSVTIVPERADPLVPADGAGDGPELAGLDLALGIAAIIAERLDAVGKQVSRRTAPVTHLMLRPPLVGERLQPGHWLEMVVRRGHRERALAQAQLEKALDVIVPMVTAEVLKRVDQGSLTGLVEEIVDTIDLPEIIRESSGSMASETIQGARMQAIAADEAISRLVDRMLLRRRPAKPGQR